MSFPFPINVNIPAANNDPAADQPIMKQNYANIAGFLAVDHVPAGTNPGAAFHKQITYYKKNPTDYVPAAAPIDPISYGFTARANNAAFGASPQSPQITQMQDFYWNSQAPYLLNAIKAFGLLQLNNTPVTPPGPNLTILNGWNVNTLITRATGGGFVAGRDFAVNLIGTSVTGNLIIPFFMPQNTTSPNVQVTVTSWSFTNPTLSFSLSSAVSANFNMALMVLQV